MPFGGIGDIDQPFADSFDLHQIFPLNESNRKFLSLLPDMAASNVRPVINRLFAMGALVQSHEGQDPGKAAFAFLKRHVGDGIVLTGTGKPTHLRENVASFNAAVSAQA